uniref:Uncharacterized protein n=1 Tax=Chromera velia CCMP2878 TaxID=1169474 RepID=A0A0G4I9F6_9ALVE|eukprot:Cvel_12141.t1-p1 / transcript=Cvel_12141.t1 / gene=Cvel_12141 / organism=Chromera_velia_CCMP2878 / gene_product=hypothetical protein / transcript_product=hypothetical protein / location=Cvel_scaffold782:53523-54572(+) / protein_length=350 / sequence_SO=supercontig / SO=protein_coding / is_pseudo=false
MRVLLCLCLFTLHATAVKFRNGHTLQEKQQRNKQSNHKHGHHHHHHKHRLGHQGEGSCKSTLVPQFAAKVDGDKSCHKVSLREGCEGKNPGDPCNTSVSDGGHEKCVATAEDEPTCFCRNSANLPAEKVTEIESSWKASVSDLSASCENAVPPASVTCTNTLIPMYALRKDQDHACHQVQLKEGCNGKASGDSCDTTVSEGDNETCIAAEDNEGTCFCRNRANVQRLASDPDKNSEATEFLAKGGCTPPSSASGAAKTLCKVTLVPSKATLRSGNGEGKCKPVVLIRTCNGKEPGSSCDTSVTDGEAETCMAVSENPDVCFCRNAKNLDPPISDHVASVQILSNPGCGDE